MKELFTTYGAFITMLLGLIGYFIHRFFNYKTKKSELDYSFFQEQKMKCIVKFFDCYSNAEKLWAQFPINRVLSEKVSDVDMDNMILPVMNPLRTTISELTLYMDQATLQPFIMINTKFSDLNAVVYRSFFSPIKGKERILLAGDFIWAREKILVDCQELIKQIGNSTRVSFLK